MPWTLDELTRRVNGVLQHEGVFQGNGQVAEAPNARAIRWYQSTGLVRRPEQRGRTAYYGPAHLNELVAIKRLQALGLSLAEVQSKLVGADDIRVAAIAHVPPPWLDLTVTAFTVTDTVSEDEREDWWAAEGEDAPISALPTTPRIAVEFEDATLVLPKGCTAPTHLVGQLLATLLQQLAEAGHLPTPTAHAAQITNTPNTKESE